MSLPSGLLSPEENELIRGLMTPKRQQSLSTTVARLHLASPSQGQGWTVLVTGVVCFVKDFDRRSYYIVALDMDRGCQVWEQEIYSEMVYRHSQPCFHSFEAEREVAGISFADEREAQDFLNAVRWGRKEELATKAKQ